MRTKEGNKEKQILDASVRVFAEYGYHNSKISKIAEVAGVATGSVYVYYKNKEELLEKLFENFWENLLIEAASIKENTTFNSAEKLDLIIDLVIDNLSQNPSLTIVFVNEQRAFEEKQEFRFMKFYEKFLDMGAEIIKGGITKREFSKDVDVEILKYFIFGAMRILLQHWAQQPDKFKLTRIRQNVKYLIKHGILINK